MEDRDIMQKELLAIKAVCDLYLHGTLESTTAEVHSAFKNALNESINIQNKIYNLMAEKGWYNMQQVEQQKIDTVKQQYANKQ